MYHVADRQDEGGATDQRGAANEMNRDDPIPKLIDSVVNVIATLAQTKKEQAQRVCQAGVLAGTWG